MIKVLAIFLSFLVSCSYMKSPIVPRQLVIERKWVRQTQGNTRSIFNYHLIEPVVTPRVVYQGNAIDGISAYERESGRLLWKLNIENGLGGGAQLVKDSLYFGSHSGHFYSVKASTGEIQWTFPTRSESLGAPFVYANSVYFVSSNNTLYVLDKATGRQKWLYARSTSPNLTIRVLSQPFVHKSMVYVGFTDGAFVALDTQNGQLKWEQQLSDNKKRFRDINTFPVKDGSRLYVGGYDGFLFCLNIQTGNIIWKIDGGGYTPVTIEGDHLFYSDSNGFVRALDKMSGKTLWHLKLKKGVASQPKFFKGLILFGASRGDLMVVDANTGEIKYRYTTGKGVTGTPYVDKKTGEIYFISAAANLFALKIGWKRINPIFPWEKQ